jgi:hypothetical protein
MAARVKVVKAVDTNDISSPSVQEQPKMRPQVLIDNTFKPENVLQLDQEDRELLFDQKEGFLMMDDSLVSQLSRENRQRYHLAKQFHDAWMRSSLEKQAVAIETTPEIVGSASDKLSKMQTVAGLHTRWVRPDRLREVLAQGYKIVQAHEATTLLGAQGNQHTISQNGRAELILVGIPKEIYEKRQKEKTERNKARAAIWEQSGKNELEQLGATRGFVAKDDTASGQWSEIE